MDNSKFFTPNSCVRSLIDAFFHRVNDGGKVRIDSKECHFLKTLLRNLVVPTTTALESPPCYNYSDSDGGLSLPHDQIRSNDVLLKVLNELCSCILTKAVNDAEIFSSIVELVNECLSMVPIDLAEPVIQLLLTASLRSLKIAQSSDYVDNETTELDDTGFPKKYIHSDSGLQSNNLSVSHSCSVLKMFLWIFYKDPVNCKHHINSIEELTKDILVDGDENVTLQFLHTVVPTLLRNKSVIFGSILQAVAKRTDSSERTLLIICGVADYLFQVEFNLSVVDSWKDYNIWMILQNGISSADTLQRKRSLYILKRIIEMCENNCSSFPRKTSNNVFYWDLENVKRYSSLWQDYILILEMLEEKHIHVLKPLMPRLRSLIDATYENTENGCAYLHSSWILNLFHRIFGHESSFIQKWGCEQLLSIDPRVCPIVTQQTEFFAKPFLMLINEASYFYRNDDAEVGSCPIVASKLHEFMKGVFDSMKRDSNQQGAFWRRFIGSMKIISWSGSVLFFISQGLAKLPNLCLLQNEDVQTIKEILIGTSTVVVKTRIGIKWFLTKAILNLINTDIGGVDQATLVSYLCVVNDDVIERGSSLWKEAVDKLKYLSDGDGPWSSTQTRIYLRTTVELMEKTPVDIESILDGFTKFLLLCVDAEIISVDNSNDSLSSLLSKVIEVLNTVATRVYMSRHKIDVIFSFIVHLHSIASPITGDKLEHFISSVISTCRKEMLDYISIRISHEVSDFYDVAKVDLYVRCVEVISCVQPNSDMAAMLNIFTDSCIDLLKSAKNQESHEKKLSLVTGTAVLANLCKLSGNVLLYEKIQSKILEYCDLQIVTSEIKKPEFLPNKCNDISAQGNFKHKWGRLISRYNTSQWQCMQFCLQHEHIRAMFTDELRLTQLLEAIKTGLDTCASPAIIPIFKCIKLLCGEILKFDITLMIDMSDMCWTRLIEQFKNKDIFWPAYQVLIEIMYTPCMTSMAKLNTNLDDCLREFADRIFQLGDAKNGIINILVSVWCKKWILENDMVSASYYHLYILKAAIFGPVHKRCLRFNAEMKSYLNTFSIYENMDMKDSDLREDHMVRVMLLTSLMHLKTNEEDHRSFVETFVHEAIAKYKQVLQQKKYRCFTNSMSHREKHRLIATVLMLEPFLSQEAQEKYIPYLCEVLNKETQPSVRILVEWMLIKIFNRFASLRDIHVWTILNQVSSKKPAFICSLMLITFHVGKLLTDNAEQEEYFGRFLQFVFPLCLSHQFNVRVFAQVILTKMWDLSKEKALNQILYSHSILGTMQEYLMQPIGNSSKSIHALQNHYMFKFDPLKDYSIQSIFYTIPRLSGLADDEWLTPTDFLTYMPDLNSMFISLVNEKLSELESCSSNSLTWKMKGAENEDVELLDGDVQRKITPWRTMFPNEEAQREIEDRKVSHHNSDAGILLVASLVDKIPNLGGLCRTCEVFGANEFVIGSMKYLENQNFQSLSVSSERWINIKEVKPIQLKEYINEMRCKGYSIVGVEQTANSACLSEFKFPDKTMLILGHEKTGIPVDLIQELDNCVEIPQYGIIRSLNVHVSGALLMWEYNRQQLLKSKVTK
ncbi:tRNA (guanosine(18)-2'-O)-methyltransferase TARBP1-like [Tubulanus polymorphus]|uniref:tRNA (guanosine(18)-2'-O)-methyltransferase TARBP1-like n=1 Tax=Tubulanus polymorphus TaxID=672921 RepID=UPI003DA43632